MVDCLRHIMEFSRFNPSSCILPLSVFLQESQDARITQTINTDVVHLEHSLLNRSLLQANANFARAVLQLQPLRTQHRCALEQI